MRLSWSSMRRSHRTPGQTLRTSRALQRDAISVGDEGATVMAVPDQRRKQKARCPIHRALSVPIVGLEHGVGDRRLIRPHQESW